MEKLNALLHILHLANYLSEQVIELSTGPKLYLHFSDNLELEQIMVLSGAGTLLTSSHLPICIFQAFSCFCHNPEKCDYLQDCRSLKLAVSPCYLLALVATPGKNTSEVEPYLHAWKSRPLPHQREQGACSQLEKLWLQRSY